MDKATNSPTDLRLIFHDNLSDSYEMSKVLLATADFNGTLQLLTSGWERVLGYGREELKGKTLLQLMWSDLRSAAEAAAAILDRLDLGPVDLRVRCRDGQGKCLRLNRLYDKREQMMYIVAEETADNLTAAVVRGHA
jgi:PAS domain S-box-containing protein